MIDLSRLDVVFLSYDEPNADANFARLAQLVPRAKRVHGVTGFDAAHRRVGEVAETDHVVTIDADNRIVDPRFLSGRFDAAPCDRHCVFSFRARNTHNGLEYGNGGVKIWPRSTLRTLRSHENAAESAAAVDFWSLPFYQMDRVLSEVHVTTTPEQAFRAGFREGVKLNFAGGALAYDAYPELPRADALRRHVGGNVERLRIWCCVGADAPNGDWAIFGARLGCATTALDGFDHRLIADFSWMRRYWEETILPRHVDPSARTKAFAALGRRLNAELGLDLADLDPAASRFVRSVHRTRRSYGLVM